MESSDTRYAQSGDVHVAYRVFGAGPFDLVFAMGMDFPSVEFHDHADGSDFNELTDRMRVLRFDKRGTGASDRVSGVPSLEERMDAGLARVGGHGGNLGKTGAAPIEKNAVCGLSLWVHCGR